MGTHFLRCVFADLPKTGIDLHQLPDRLHDVTFNHEYDAEVVSLGWVRRAYPGKTKTVVVTSCGRLIERLRGLERYEMVIPKTLGAKGQMKGQNVHPTDWNVGDICLNLVNYIPGDTPCILVWMEPISLTRDTDFSIGKFGPAAIGALSLFEAVFIEWTVTQSRTPLEGFSSVEHFFNPYAKVKSGRGMTKLSEEVRVQPWTVSGREWMQLVALQKMKSWIRLEGETTPAEEMRRVSLSELVVAELPESSQDDEAWVRDYCAKRGVSGPRIYVNREVDESTRLPMFSCVGRVGAHYCGEHVTSLREEGVRRVWTELRMMLSVSNS